MVHDARVTRVARVRALDLRRPQARFRTPPALPAERSKLRRIAAASGVRIPAALGSGSDSLFGFAKRELDPSGASP